MIANFDNGIIDVLQKIHNPVLDKIMVFLSSLGNSGGIWILIGIFLMIYYKKRSSCGLSVLLSVTFGFIAGNLLIKNIIRRSRPNWINSDISLLIANPTDYSFPSGHTLSSFAAATAIFCYNKKAGIAAYVLASCIAFSRLYLYVHYPTDIIGGIIIGVVVALITVHVVKKKFQTLK